MRYLLVLLILTGLAGAETRTYENRRPASGKPIGWSYKIPSDWKEVLMPEKSSEGHKSPDGAQWVLVTWSTEPLHDQMDQLKGMGFKSEDTRLAGRQGWRLERAENQRYDRMTFIRLDDGWIRLALGSKSGKPEGLTEIETSFSLLALEVVGWVEAKGPGFHCSLPSGLRTEIRENGLAVLSTAGKEVALVTKHPLARNRSLRAFARGYVQAELANFQPFETKAGSSCYLTSWKQKDQKEDRVVAFIPTADGSVLVVEPKVKEALSDVPRWLKSFR